MKQYVQFLQKGSSASTPTPASCCGDTSAPAKQPREHPHARRPRRPGLQLQRPRRRGTGAHCCQGRQVRRRGRVFRKQAADRDWRRRAGRRLSLRHQGRNHLVLRIRDRQDRVDQRARLGAASLCFADGRLYLHGEQTAKWLSSKPRPKATASTADSRRPTSPSEATPRPGPIPSSPTAGSTSTIGTGCGATT